MGLAWWKNREKEHLEKAAQREILEECGINTDFIKFNGLISEHLIEGEEILQHFLLHICTLKPLSNKIKNTDEGELKWFELDNLKSFKEEIIPSDFLIIERMIKASEKNYFNCIIEKKSDNYFLKMFE